MPTPNQPFNRYVSTAPSDVFSTDASTGSAAAVSGPAHPRAGFIQGVLSLALAVDKNVTTDSCSWNNVCRALAWRAADARQDPSKYNNYAIYSGQCVLTATYAELAYSPAFSGPFGQLLPVGTAANNYNDGRNPRLACARAVHRPDPRRYSTMTESQWGSISMRIFLVESPAEQVCRCAGAVCG